MKKTILIIIVLCIIGLFINIVYINFTTSVHEIENYQPYYPDKILKWIDEAEEQDTSEDNTTVLIGDSITKYSENYDVDLNNTVNIGLPGATSYDVYNALDEIYFSLDTDIVETVVITLGTNDWVIDDQYDAYTSDFTVDCINAIVGEIYKDNPYIDIYVVEPFHVTYFEGSVYDSTKDAEDRNEFIDNINHSLESNLSSKATLIDINDDLDDSSGDINSSYVKDGLHPNQQGYDVIIPLIKSEIDN